MLSYGQSKTANILHAVAVDKRGKPDGIRAFSLHPGTIVDSNFKRYTPPEVLTAFGLVDENGDAVIDPRSLARPSSRARPRRRGARRARSSKASVVCTHRTATSLPSSFRARRSNIEFGSPPLGVMTYAVDTDIAEQLWTASEKLTQVRLAA